MHKNYKGIIGYLIEQCKNPSGFIGARMIDIWNKAFENMTLWGLSNISFEKSDVILDIGCGGGNTINILSNKTNEKVFGVDISNMAVKKAKIKNRKNIQQNKVDISQSAVEGLPFKNYSFNKILAIQTHIYWNNLETSLNEIFRTLKTCGVFTIICEKDKIKYHLHKYLDKNIMTNLLYNIGFKNIRLKETNTWIQYICFKE